MARPCKASPSIFEDRHARAHRSLAFLVAGCAPQRAEQSRGAGSGLAPAASGAAPAEKTEAKPAASAGRPR